MKFQLPFLRPIAFACAISFAGAASADATFIYLTRHAEKVLTGDNPALTAAGQSRAQNIATTLKKANIKHIYATNYLRTQQTAQPLSTLLGLPVETYDPAQLAALAQQLRARSENALVVGHSDTTPELIRLLSGDVVDPIAETEFDRLYQVAIGLDGDTTTTLFNSIATPVACGKVTLNQSNLAATIGNWLYFTINVPSCAKSLNVKISGGTGDANLYVRPATRPTTTTYSCRSIQAGNTESCVLAAPAAGIWHIGVRANSTFSGLTIDASTTE